MLAEVKLSCQSSGRIDIVCSSETAIEPGFIDALGLHDDFLGFVATLADKSLLWTDRHRNSLVTAYPLHSKPARWHRRQDGRVSSHFWRLVLQFMHPLIGAGQQIV